MKDSEDRGQGKNRDRQGPPSKAGRSGRARSQNFSSADEIPGTLPRNGGKAKPSPKRTTTTRVTSSDIPGTLSDKPAPKQQFSLRTKASGQQAGASANRSQQTGKKKGGRQQVRSQGQGARLRGGSAASGASRKPTPAQRNSTRPKKAAVGASAGSFVNSIKGRIGLGGSTKRAYTPEDERRKRLLVSVVVIIIIAVLIVGAGIYLYAQLNKRGEQIVAETEKDTFEVVPCEPGMLDMEMNRTGSVAGNPVSFGITMTNNGDQPCSLDTGTSNLVLEVTSGNDSIWASNHCVEDGPSRVYVFGPGVSSTLDVHWSGARSTTDCASGLPAPNPGTYVVKGYVDGTEFPELRDSFVLTDSNGIAPVEEAPSEEPEEATGEEEAEEQPTDEPTEEATTIEPPPEDHEYVPD